MIPGVLGRLLNSNITYKFLCGRPVFPDYPFLMAIVKLPYAEFNIEAISQITKIKNKKTRIPYSDFPF